MDKAFAYIVEWYDGGNGPFRQGYDNELRANEHADIVGGTVIDNTANAHDPDAAANTAALEAYAAKAKAEADAAQAEADRAATQAEADHAAANAAPANDGNQPAA